MHASVSATFSVIAATPEYSARYLVLFDANDALPRAALFDRHQQLLAEMVEPDPLMLDTLVHGSPTGPLPFALAQAIANLDKGANTHQARCFLLN